MKKLSLLLCFIMTAAVLVTGCNKNRNDESGAADEPETGYAIEDNVYEFIDSGIEENVRATIGKPEGFITEEEVSKIESLMIYNISYEVMELSDLSGFSSLTSLRIYSDTVSDITALKSLKLKSLAIESSTLEDVAALAEIDTLEELYIERCAVTDISSLGKLKGLKVLSLAGCEIEDLTPLLELKGLVKLDLRGVKAPIPEELLERDLEIITD